MGRSHGTGYPIFFECAKARRIWYSASSFNGRGISETSLQRGAHVVELTGRTKPTPRNGKGHPRKSWTTYEYRCACGHVGWSSHRDLERRAAQVAEQRDEHGTLSS